MLVIDGFMGEGGGQILRSSLTLSLCSGRPFRITNLRAGRKRPGLRHQHLASVQAAAEIGHAKVEGAALGSKELTFVPSTVRWGDFHFDIGTAGSTTLLLQSVLPALMKADGPSQLVLEGGTHNPLAPPFDFLQRVFLPIVNCMGPKVDVQLQRVGFYPKGGGRLRVEVRPANHLERVDLQERGEIQSRQAVAIVAGLPRHIAERELKVIRRELGLSPDSLHVKEEDQDRGPGNVVTIEIGSKYITEIFAGFGKRGVKAEAVAGQAVRAALRYLHAGVPVGEHLADQLLLPFALAGGGTFRTLRPTLHTQTNAMVVELFLGVRIATEKVGEDAWKVSVS